ncbi:MAG TPA: hypothetical protein VFP54_04380 [Acidimicrobiales bacterium]|nr:hypothetical protein [Acidimicrobiales bacterium]
MNGSQQRLKVVGHGDGMKLRLVGDWDGRPLEGLRVAQGVEKAIDKLVREQVGRARNAGCSWSDIGEALGTTKQAAWERYSNET